MKLDPKVARARFAAFVERALRDARARGMSDLGIKEATGIPPSTFHRWQQGGGGLPQIDKVIEFCEGLDIPPAAALAALGATESAAATPEAPPEPVVDLIQRKLRDPNVSDAEKEAIRHTLNALAGPRR